MHSNDFSINWNRSVQVSGRISDELVNRLIPEILRLRQSSNEPITIAINSYGGSIDAIDPILNLIQDPDQSGRRSSTITVVTNEAYSAAASLLAFGGYAVALPSSTILFHDVRFGEMEDVTPDKAKSAALRLQTMNERFALRLAGVVFRRLMWQYIDVQSELHTVYTDSVYENFKKTVDLCSPPKSDKVDVDVAGFATWIHRHLFSENAELVRRVFTHLDSWGQTMRVAKLVPMYRNEEGRAGLLDGALEFFNTLKPPAADDPRFGVVGRDEELRLFLVRLIAQLLRHDRTTRQQLEAALADYTLLQSINDPSHMDQVSKLILRHQSAFFNVDAKAILEGDDSGAKAELMDAARPFVNLLWLFCVLLCRELLTGDHVLVPREALVLGVVDEVPGDEIFESRRQFRIAQEKRARERELKDRKPIVRRLTPSMVRKRSIGGV